MTTTADLREFNRAIANVARYSKRPAADLLNWALRDVAYRSAQFTPKANKSKVLRDVGATGRNGKIWAIASVRANRKYGKGQWSAAQRAEIVEALKAKSAQGIGALKAGWAPAIIALGGSFRGTVRANGSISGGLAIKATEARLAGMIRNTVITRDKDGNPFSADEIALARIGLQKAIAFVTNQRNQSAIKKMNELLRRNSDR